MHPIERLRAVARARDVDQRLLTREAAIVLGAMADDPLGLITSCRRLLDRHPGAGTLWWACARLLDAREPRAEARAVARDLDEDDALLRTLSLDLPERATVVVIPDAAGGSGLVDGLAVRRDDLVPVQADDPALDVAAVVEANASLGATMPEHGDAEPFAGGRRRRDAGPGEPGGPAAGGRETGGAGGAGAGGTRGRDTGAGGGAGTAGAAGEPGGAAAGGRERADSAGSGGAGAAGATEAAGAADMAGSAGARGGESPPARAGASDATGPGRAPALPGRSGLLGVSAFGSPGSGPTIVLVEAGATGPHRFLGVPGTAEGIAAARARGLPVWLVVGVGARLPGALFDAAAARASACEAVPSSATDRLIEPRSIGCPCPPELLRPWPSS